ncbi:hypothetical protein [Ferrovibrio terrae]|uniref:hypothetical protein n=1 Tax=Ferrovibrio terrae TaxID=2594003 RepID=UPI0031381247
MSAILSAVQVVEESLRKIGAYSINDSAADGTELRVGLTWLDLIMAHLSGSTQIFWLIRNEVSLPLVTAQRSYQLPNALNASAPTNDLQFINGATLIDETGSRTPLTMLDYQTYNAVTNKDDVGDPTGVYVERLVNPVLYTYPVAQFDVSAGQTRRIELSVQTFANTVSGNRPAAGVQSEGSLQHGLRQSWQKWAIYELAASLGDGTVRNLPSGRLDRLRDVAIVAKKELLAFENRENFDAPNQTAYRDY